MSAAILILSILLQLTAAVLALHHIRTTGKYFAWVAISAALVLMAVRRCITLAVSIHDGSFASVDPVAEFTALLISVCMVVGVYSIGKIFQKLKHLQNQLEDEKQIEHRHAETFRKAHSFLSGAMDGLPSQVAVIDEKGVVVYVNRAWREFGESLHKFGRKRYEGSNYLQVCKNVTGEDRRYALSAADGIESVLRNQSSEFVLEYPCITPHEKRQFSLRVTRYTDAGKLYAVVIHTDVTSLHLAQKALHTLAFTFSADTGQDLFDQVSRYLVKEYKVDYAYIGEFVEHHQKVVTCSFCFQETLLDSVEYELQHTPCEKLTTQPYCSIDAGVQEAFPNDPLLAEYQVESFLGIQLTSNAGEKLGVIGLLHSAPMSDLESLRPVLSLFGERVAHEMERLKTEEQMRFAQYAIEHTTDAAFWIRKDGSFFYVNEAACRNLGYTQEELLQLSVPDIAILEEDWEMHWKKNIQTYPSTFLSLHLRKDRSTFPVEVTANYFQHDGEEYMFALARDVTERITVLESLQKSEQQFRAVVENSPDYILFIDPEYAIRYLNRVIPGYTLSETIGHSVLELVLPHHYQPFKQSLDDTFQNRHPNRLEICTIDSQYFDTRIIPITLSDQQHYALVIATDITEKKEAALELQEQAERLTLATQSAGYAVWEYDLITQELIWDKAMYVLYGVPKHQFQGTYHDWLNCVHEDDVERMENLFHIMIREGNSIHTQFKIRLPDNSIRYIETHSVPIQNEMGLPVRITGLNKDITASIENEMQFKRMQYILNQAELLISVGGWVWDISSNRFTPTEQWKRIHGCDQEEMTLEELWGYAYPDDRSRIEAAFQRAVQGDGIYDIEHRIVHQKNQEVRWLRVYGQTEYSPEGEALRIFGACLDITETKHKEAEQKKLQSQLFHSQKMESLGSLTSGIAHDFNNILMGIIGYCDLALMVLDNDHHLFPHVTQILKASRRGTDLTKRLLTFSRKQEVQPVVIHPDEKIREIYESLLPLLGRTVQVELKISPDLHRIEADPGQLDQVLLNLAVNARDAMPEGGTLTIEAKNMILDESYYLIDDKTKPGEYVLISVSDTGIGMDKDLQQKIFEPFFTTKDESKGTGLGLSTVYGIVQQNGGFITVYSEPGKGTVFHVYLPSIRIQKPPAVMKIPAGVGRVYSKTVLLLDDERVVLVHIQNILKQKGYTVFATTSPGKAEEWFQQHQEETGLFITDLVMPETSGKDVAQAVLNLKPDMKVIFISGYSAETLEGFDFLGNQFRFLQKPFAMNEFLTMIQELLSENR